MIGLIRSELLKVVTTRVWWGLLIGVVAQSVALTLLTTLLSAVNTPDGGSGPDWHDPAWARTVYSSGLSIAYLCTLALGALSMSGERRHRTLSVTLLASPHRWRVVVAKLVAVVVAGTGYGVATVLASVAVGAPILASKGGSSMLTDGSVLRAMALTALAIGLWTVLGLGVGTLIPNQVVAIVVPVAVAWIVDPILSLVLNLNGHGSIARFLASSASSAMASPVTSAGQGFDVSLLPWWGGALVMLGYAAVLGGAGAAATLQRDVT
jgi:ABC-type transport system involved in multi-copper enzyme maturation permease subunit